MKRGVEGSNEKRLNILEKELYFLVENVHVIHLNRKLFPPDAVRVALKAREVYAILKSAVFLVAAKFAHTYCYA